MKKCLITDIDTIGQQVQIISEKDILDMIKILSKNTWLKNFPPLFIELLNNNKQITIEAIKYAPNVYFKLKPEFKKDKQIIKATIKSYEYHNRLNEIITSTTPLLKKTTTSSITNMKTIKEQLDQEYVKNYIKLRASLIANNIATTYFFLGNNHSLTYNQICTESEDIFNLSYHQIKYVNTLVKKELKDRYNLKIVTKDKNSILKIQKLN